MQIFTPSFLHAQWFKLYDQLLSGYMRKDTGVGMDLTLARPFPAPSSVPCVLGRSMCMVLSAVHGQQASHLAFMPSRMRHRRRARTLL